MARDLSEKLSGLIKKSKDFDFPGLRMRAFLSGNEIANVSVGKFHTYYDVASLTKIIFTTTYFAEAVYQEKLALKDPLQKYLKWYPHKSVQVGHLLNHSARNSWWQPYYRKLNLDLPYEQRYQQLELLCRDSKRSDDKKAVYSDLDFFLLGSLMQELESAPFETVWSELKQNYWPHSDFHFCVGNVAVYDTQDYAPTERCPWRKKLLRGQVHDENAWALGGVAPHAGLFGSLDDLAAYGLWLRTLIQQQDKGGLAEVIGTFTKRSLSASLGDWGYGFMLPSKKGSSAGELMSKKSVGHTGFTGTSLWFDPERDLLVCLLSNRVSPTREQTGFVKLRPKIHDWIIQSLEE